MLSNSPNYSDQEGSPPYGASFPIELEDYLLNFDTLDAPAPAPALWPEPVLQDIPPMAYSDSSPPSVSPSASSAHQVTPVLGPRSYDIVPHCVVKSTTDQAKRRRERNTEAARRSRGRTKERITELEALVEKLTKDNDELRERVRSLTTSKEEHVDLVKTEDQNL